MSLVRTTVLAIDAGGTSTRARAVSQAITVHSGTGGPGNPLTVARSALAHHYAQALEGCPAPTIVVACVAGAGGRKGCEQITALLTGRFPNAAVHVFPDYVGAWMAAPQGTDAVVVAGTGSVVCSRTIEGTFVSSGGVGWILGDHGSAARLGRALLEHYCLFATPWLAADIQATFGTSAPDELAARVLSSTHPPSLLAKAAPILTAAADSGHEWARKLLASELAPLAQTVASHAARHLSSSKDITVALAGGVWMSVGARSAFAAALSESAAACSVVRVARESIDGVVRLAVELSNQSSA